ncbi:MAG: aspartate kinase [Chitinophagaceae bacterium]|nr:aspartate kinase [Chitinophagaceae bacterium]
MQVFKFGGASVNSVDRIKNLAAILGRYKGEKLMVIISAMGKTTNALEKVTEAFFDGRKEDALQLFQQVKKQHLDTAKFLLVTQYLPCEHKLADFFTEVEWLLHDKPVRDFDYYYDQVVCIGELLSTTIISAYLNEKGIANHWLDVRDIFRTDDDFRDASIDWDFTLDKVTHGVLPLFRDHDLLLTQGFIGATDENESTTLGREGSDYSAAIFANMMDAKKQVIWKDVESVMNADPKQFPDATAIHELNYKEVIEMAYYGAQVIHPKTIKPLQNKNIPLLVKCFFDPELEGTLIHNHPIKNLPPIIVLKEKQAMVKFSVRDFSFVGEHHIGQLYALFEKFHIKPNLTQNAAISFLAVLDDKQERIEKMALEASSLFDVDVIKGLQLLTIRHFNEATLKRFTKEKSILLRQQTTETVQLLLKSNQDRS